MKDEQCVRFLQWALPQLEMRWPGFRKVRRQVCKRVDRRTKKLCLADVEEYRDYLDAHADEWARLDSLCRITISRFCRDRGVFATLARDVLPALAEQAQRRGGRVLRIWSAGCASGEEPYTLSILWRLELAAHFPELRLEIVATDADPNMLERARGACYSHGSLKDLPDRWRKRAFRKEDKTFRLEPEFRGDIEFLEQDIRVARPDGTFDLVLCRNLVFTYFDAQLQRRLLRDIVGAMRADGGLVLGSHERLPEGAEGLSVWFEKQRVYRRSERR